LDVFSSSRTRIGQDEIRNFERLSGVSRKAADCSERMIDSAAGVADTQIRTITVKLRAPVRFGLGEIVLSLFLCRSFSATARAFQS
jgi:hypothetical protein